MKDSVLNLTVLCFSIGAEIITRIILIIINSMVYQSFVIAEVLMNNYAVLYPQYISDVVNEVRTGCYYIIYFMLRTASKKLVLMHVWLRWCCRALVSLSWVIVYPLTYLLSIRRNRKCPPPTNPLLMKSATTLVSMIAKRQVTSEEVVSAYIERCKEVNPYLNAIVEPRYDAALREARYIDKMVASNERTPEQLMKEFPLLGVPMTVKESIAVEGMSNDCGTVYPVRNPAKKDADIVKRARAAGAIPIAVTNTPQLCMNWETYNNVTGLTMNPYDQKRTTGGSSGGECALLASAASVIGVGSDIAGSLRLPPMFNGVFGHKPTPRLLSVEGHNPDCLDPEFEEYFALGPMARYAEDLTLMLRVLRHPSGPQVPLEKPVDIKRLKFYYMEYDESYITNKIGPDVKKAFDKARAYMKHTHGIEVEKLKIKNVGDMFEISVRLLFNIQHIKNIYTDPENRTGWVSLWPNVLKKMFGLSDHSLTAVCYGVVKKFFDILPKSSYNNIVKQFEEIKQDFDRTLSDDAVLLFPTYPAPAHLHYRVFSKFLNCGYLTIFNCLGLPATACPMGLTDSGLPVGLQIVANKNNDHLTIAVAKEFEMAFGGWVPPNKQSMIMIKTA